MSIIKKTVYLVTFCELLTCVQMQNTSAHNVPVSAEKRLLDHIFKGYDTVVRPVLNSSESVRVDLLLGISKIDELIMKSETLVTSGWLSVSWYDERLTWDPVDYDGLDTIVVPPTMVWLPDFTLMNSHNPDIYIDGYYKWFRVIIESDGYMGWEPGGRFITRCNISVTLFPFDEQECEIIFANWAYSSSQVNLTISEIANSSLTQLYEDNGQWELIEHHIYKEEIYFVCCPDIPFPYIIFSLTLKRKPIFYMMNIVVPSSLLSLLVLLAFRLPPESGEKMSMDVTLLLSYTVFILMVSESVPETSQAVPLIVIYLVFSMVLTSLSVLAEVLVLLAHYGRSLGKPPRIMKIISRYINGSKFVQDPVNTEDVNRIVTICGDVNPMNVASVRCPDGVEGTDTHHDIIRLLSQLLERVDAYERRTRVEEHQNQQHKLWKDIAQALDTIFFWIMLTIFIIGTVTILAVIPATSK